MMQWGVNNLPKVVAQQRHGRGSNLRPLDRKSDTLPLSHPICGWFLRVRPFDSGAGLPMLSWIKMSLCTLI